jgi:hypothetical protein
MNENLQDFLKSAAHESLGKMKRRNRREYLQIWHGQVINRTKENIVKEVVGFRKARRQKKKNTKETQN